MAKLPGWQGVAAATPKKCLPPHLPPRLLEVSPIYIYWMVLYFLLLKLLISLVTCLSLRTKIFMSPLPCKMVESMNPICSLLTVRICRFIQMKTETVWKPTNWRQANCTLAVMKKGTVQLKLESRKCDGWSYVIDNSVVISIVYLIASLQKSIGLVASSLYSCIKCIKMWEDDSVICYRPYFVCGIKAGTNFEL